MPLLLAAIAWAGEVALWAQLPDSGTPATVMGAFITIALGMFGLVGWIVKRAFDEIRQSREDLKDARTVYGTEVETIRKYWGDRLDQERKIWEQQSAARDAAVMKVVEVFRSESQADRDHLARERQLSADLADAARKQRHQEQEALRGQYEDIKCLLEDLAKTKRGSS